MEIKKTIKGITGYSVAEAATLLDLHPKTVRRFIREGQIKGKKIGREWRIRQEDLREYCHGELAEDQVEPKSSIRLGDRVHVSTVIEIMEGSSEEVSRISNSIIAALNCKDPAWGATRYDLIYHPETRKARFVIFGRPAFVRNLLELVEVLTNEDEGGEGNAVVVDAPR
jgi:excisionase family DNA binding protein